jgi:hypothetical protein
MKSSSHSLYRNLACSSHTTKTSLLGRRRASSTPASPIVIRRSIGEIIAGLLLLRDCLTSDDMKNHVEFL